VQPKVSRLRVVLLSSVPRKRALPKVVQPKVASLKAWRHKVVRLKA
jgi:hypothetical protein